MRNGSKCGLLLVLPWLLAAPGAAAEEPVISAPARAYVTNELSGDLTVIDLATRLTVATVPLGKRPRGIAPSPDGRLLYIALSGAPIGESGGDGRKLLPADIARVVLFLAADDSDACTNQSYVVDGGWV